MVGSANVGVEQFAVHLWVELSAYSPAIHWVYKTQNPDFVSPNKGYKH